MKKKKDELVLGQTYWSFYFDFTKSQNKLKDYCGVFEVIPTERNESSTKGYYYYRWDVKGIAQFPYPMNHNITNRLGDYGAELYETREEAVAAHDKKISERAVTLNTADRDRMLKKLIAASKPPVEPIEVKSIKWFESLPDEEKEYVKWIKHFYEKI